MPPLTSANAPLIMLGCQRSGTTLAARILASHPRGGFGSEFGVIRFAIIWFRHLCTSPAAFRNLRMVEFLHAFRRTGGENGPPELQHIFNNVQRVLALQIRSGRLENWAESMDVDGFIRALCFESHSLDIPDLAFWGDKYPEYLFHLEALNALFPDGRYIFLRRHPGDVMESLFRHRNTRRGFTGSLRFTMADCRDQWTAWNRLWHNFKEQIPATRRIEVPFEELAGQPQEMFARLETFLGTPLLDSEELRSLLERVDPGQVGKWRRMPAARLVASCPTTPEFEELCDLYGYSPPSSGEITAVTIDTPAKVERESAPAAAPTAETGVEATPESAPQPPVPGSPLPDPPPAAPGDIDAPEIDHVTEEMTAETPHDTPSASAEPAAAAEPGDDAPPSAPALPPPPEEELLLRGPALLRPEAVGKRPKVKLLVIGLDGMTPNVLFDELPRLESFQALIQRGSHGPLASVSPPMSGCAWPSFFTGLDPRHHGFDESQRRFEDMSYLDVRATKVWEMLNAAGISTGFLNMPLAYQVDPVLGYIVPGRFAPLQRMTPAVRNTLQGYRAHPRILPQTTAEFLREQWETDRQCIHYWEKLVRAHPTDLATIVLYTPDNVGHWFWDDASAVHDSYALLDQLVGRVLNAVDAENVIIMSDHGMQGKSHPDTEEFAKVLDDKGETVHHKMQGWHQKAGIFIASGSAIAQHTAPQSLDLVDLTPIMLRLFGVTPPSTIHFDGQTPAWLFAGGEATKMAGPASVTANATDPTER